MPYDLRTATMTATDPDTDLVLTFARTRDAAALERLLARHWATAHRLALRLTGSAASAEDVAQQAFVDLVEHASRLDARREFGPWFRTLVLNRARKQVRARERRRGHEQRVPAQVATTTPALDPLDATALSERVATLPEDVRVPIVLHFYEGLSHAEVAETIGCPKGTAASRIRRGLERLHESLVTAGCAMAMPDLEQALGRSTTPVTPNAPAVGAILSAARGARRVTTALLGVATALLVAALAASVLAPEVVDAPPSRPTVATTDDRVPSTTPRPQVAAVSSATTEQAPTISTPTAVEAPASDPVDTAAETDSSTIDADDAATPKGEVTVLLVDDLGQPLPPDLPVKVVGLDFSEAGEAVFRLDHFAEAVTDATGTVRVRLDAGVEHGLFVQRKPEAGDDDPWGGPFWGQFVAPPRTELVRVEVGQATVFTRVVPRRALVTLRLTGVPEAVVAGGVSIRVANGSCYPARHVLARGVPFRLAPGRHQLRVTCRGRADLLVEVDLAPGSETVVERSLEAPRGRVTGVVVDASGRAVRDAVVLCGSESALTGADGAFELSRSPGPERLRVKAMGYCATVIETRAELSPTPLRITLQHGASIRVRVLDATGRPVADADVNVRGSMITMPGLEHIDPTGVDSRWQGFSTMNDELWMAQGQTAADGTLTLVDVPAGEYEVALTGHGARATVVARAGEVMEVDLSR